MPEPREIRRRREGSTECLRCGKRVALFAETHEWHEIGEGAEKRWIHGQYGPATGECCGLAFLDCFGEVQVLDILADGVKDLRRVG